MTLRDLLNKKDKIQNEASHASTSTGAPAPAPAFTLIRSDTMTQEAIYPPSAASTNDWPLRLSGAFSSVSPPRAEKRPSRFRSLSSQSAASADSAGGSSHGGKEKRLSTLLHLRSRSGSRSSRSSAYLPADLPAIDDDGGGGAEAEAEREAKWAKRATMLAESSVDLGVPVDPISGDGASPQPPSGAAGAGGDDIQKAIELHEKGELEASTAMLGRLADPHGANHSLAQVLYGLALRFADSLSRLLHLQSVGLRHMADRDGKRRHGWGIAPDTRRAVTYLSQAANHGAVAAQTAASSGGSGDRGVKIQGELVLALYELANCFRRGWGVPVDPVAARGYYETAGNLGDADALAEAGWCYEQGFGGRKDKVSAGPCAFM